MWQVVAAASAAAEQLGASHARLVSRAYHDALFMAQVRAAAPLPTHASSSAPHLSLLCKLSWTCHVLAMMCIAHDALQGRS